MRNSEYIYSITERYLDTQLWFYTYRFSIYVGEYIAISKLYILITYNNNT